MLPAMEEPTPRPAKERLGLAMLICLAGATLVLGIGACGGDDESDGGDSASAAVGDCVDAEENVVDCADSSATMELVSDQSDPDAIACVEIGDKPQVEVTVGETTFCAEELE
jgi:hypothetical protein